MNLNYIIIFNYYLHYYI